MSFIFFIPYKHHVDSVNVDTDTQNTKSDAGAGAAGNLQDWEVLVALGFSIIVLFRSKHVKRLIPWLPSLSAVGKFLRCH